MNNEQAWKDRGEWTGQTKCGRSSFSCDTTMPSKDRRDQYDIEQRIKVSTMLKTKMIVTTPKQIIKTQWVIAYHPKPKSQYCNNVITCKIKWAQLSQNLHSEQFNNVININQHP